MSMVEPDKVDSIIANLNNTTACGFDQIDTFIIKLIRPEVVPAITHILNLSITQKKFPSTWKKSKIIPLHKKDDPLDPKKIQVSSYCSNHFQNSRESNFQPDQFILRN